MSSKPQAVRCSTPQVNLHIARQRRLGERMVGDHDRPRWLDLTVSAILLTCIFAYGWYKGYRMPWELLL